MMDATYNTSRYDLPLFFICVNTNVGNTIVASFILPDENRDNIKEALGILAGWNPGWLPRHFMCDFDEREIWAIESTFEGCLVYLCDFHREQSWDRWLKDAKNGLREHQTEILKLLRAIAGSCTEQEFDRAVNALQASQWWGDSSRLRSWFGKKWLSHSRVDIYDYDLLLGAVNEHWDHWSLVAVYPKDKSVLYLNPLGELKEKKDAFFRNWMAFLRQWYNRSLDGPPGRWQQKTQKHPKQFDSVSCGVYVLKFAELLVSDMTLSFRTTKDDLQKIRLGIGRQLLEVSEPLDEYCRVCTFKGSEPGCLWIRCDSCPKWFHRSCLDIPLHVRTPEIKAKPFLCKFCLKEYQIEVS